MSNFTSRSTENEIPQYQNRRGEFPSKSSSWVPRRFWTLYHASRIIRTAATPSGPSSRKSNTPFQAIKWMSASSNLRKHKSCHWGVRGLLAVETKVGWLRQGSCECLLCNRTPTVFTFREEGSIGLANAEDRFSAHFFCVYGVLLPSLCERRPLFRGEISWCSSDNSREQIKLRLLAAIENVRDVCLKTRLLGF